MMILGFLFLLLAVWYWMRNRDRKGGMISALLMAVVPTVICRQQEHPMAGPFLETATRPLLETTEAFHITDFWGSKQNEKDRFNLCHPASWAVIVSLQ